MVKFSVSLQKTFYGELIVEAEDYEQAQDMTYDIPLERIDEQADWDEDYDIELTCAGIQPYEEPNKDLWS